MKLAIAANLIKQLQHVVSVVVVVVVSCLP